MGGLTLTRRVGEELICILPDKREIIFKVYEVTTMNAVRVRIEAPSDVKIVREEIAG